MNETLKQALNEVATLAGALAKRVQADGDRVPALVLARALVSADRIRTALAKTSTAVADAAKGEGGKP